MKGLVDGEVEVGASPLGRLDDGVQLPVEGLSVAVEPWHVRVLALIVHLDGRWP